MQLPFTLLVSEVDVTIFCLQLLDGLAPGGLVKIALVSDKPLVALLEPSEYSEVKKAQRSFLNTRINLSVTCEYQYFDHSIYAGLGLIGEPVPTRNPTTYGRREGTFEIAAG